MKTNEPKKDSYIKSILDESGLESPSGNFTNRVMANLAPQMQKKTFEYRPVISRTAWLVLSVLGIALFIFLMYQDSPSPADHSWQLFGYSVQIDLSRFRTFFKRIAFSFELSPVFKTSFITLAIFSLVQLFIYELKKKSLYK